MKNGKFEAADIYALLNKRFADSREWVCAREVGNATGWSAIRHIDFVAANCFESKGLGVHGFEVKISKSDLRRELEDAEKHTIFFDDIDTFSIVAPDYVLDAEYVKLIPPKWGIYKAVAKQTGVGEDGNPTYGTELKTFRKPLELHDDKTRTMNRSFAMAMLRAMSTQDTKCHPVDELQKHYNEGFAKGLETGEIRSGMYKTYWEEDAWKRQVCSSLGLYRKEDFERKRDAFESIRAFAEETHWFERTVKDVIKAANDMKEAHAKMMEALESKKAESQKEPTWETN